VHHPRKFGLTDVTNQACDGCFEDYGGTPVLNPDDYLWWDAVHFTRVVHRIRGVEAAKLVLHDDDDHRRDHHDARGENGGR
jgi:phospholipase/lecithinase/hemolysin